MSKKKIVFIWSPAPVKPSVTIPNLSISYLSRFLKVHGYDVINIDLNTLLYEYYKEIKLPDNKIEFNNLMIKIIKFVEKFNPDVMCVSNWSGNFPFSLEFVRRYKSRNCDCKVIMGGEPATFTPDEVLGILPEIDFLVRGEGELTLLELCNTINNKGSNFSMVKGISYINRNTNKIVHTPNRELIEDLDILPLIDFEEFVFKEKLTNELLNIVTTRGCPYGRCSFCSIIKKFKFYRTNSIQYILKQIKHLIKLYNPLEISINDDDFLSHKIKFLSLTRQIVKNELGVQLSCGGRGDQLNKENLILLEKAGFIHITVGVENILPKVLNLYYKAIDIPTYIKNVKEGISACKDFNISIAASFIIGSPLETKEDMIKNIEYMRHISPIINRLDISPLCIYPGSDLWERYSKGEFSIFKKGSNLPYIDDIYSNLPWVVPHAYLVKNNHYQDGTFERILNESSNQINAIQLRP